MIHIDDLSGYPFGASDLYSVCEKYAARLVKSAEVVQLDFEPTETSRTVIRHLIERSLQKARRQTILRRVATVAVVIIFVFSTIMVTNIHAREAVIYWLRQVFPDSVFYQFFGEPSDELYHYTIGWIPEGFTLKDYYENEDECYYNYKNGTNGFLIRIYSLNTYDYLSIEGYSSYEEIDVGPFKGTLYIDPIHSNVLIVIDELKQSVISINSPLDPDILIKILESIY